MERLLTLEGRRENILDRFSENTALRDMVEDFLDHEFNRRTNYKYVDWVMKRNFDDIGNIIISFDSIINWLEKFDRVRKNLQYKDINYYKNVQDLIDTLEVYGDTKSEQRNKLKSGTEKIFENDEVLVVKPLTKEASCYYGSGTRWCTAATQFSNRFEQYNSQGPLYYFIFKNLSNDNDYYKIAIHYDSRNDRYTLYDAKDMVNENLLGFIKDKPAFKAVEKDVEDNHTYDSVKDVVKSIKEVFKNMGQHLYYKYKNFKTVVDGKPLRILSMGDEKVASEYGVKEVILTIQDDDFIFYATDSNLFDKRPIYEIIEFIELVNNTKITQNTFLDTGRTIRLIFEVVKIFVNENKEYLKQGNDDIIYWRPMNSQSTYRFESMNPDNAYIKFLEYIKSQTDNGNPAYKEDFLLNVLNKDPEEVNFSGYLSSMFSSLKDAGLVSLYRAKEKPYFRYKIGPNYKDWRQGRLKRI